MTTFGIIGAGHIGSNFARAVLAHGHEVLIANSRGPETLADLVAELGPAARAATVDEAAFAADVALIAVPFNSYREVPVTPLAGKIVLDADNYYFERDGHIPELDDGETTVTRLMQQHLHESRVVKVFNNITASDIPTTGSPAGTPDRRALPIAGDDPDALAFATALLDELGFDSVSVAIDESWRFERDRPAYVVRQNRDELLENLKKATRTV